jgi:hypothetical protein
METTAAINVSEALSRADGDQDLFLTLVGSFAHKLKGSVIQMSAPRLFESAKRLEELGR